jgi:hypothetical protein
VPPYDHEYFLRQAALERQAALRSLDLRTSEIHENAAQIYEALAEKELVRVRPNL